jgi:hypothetical protein
LVFHWGNSELLRKFAEIFATLYLSFVVTGDKLLPVPLTPVTKPCPGYSSIPDFHDSFQESFLKNMSKARATARGSLKN